MALANKRRSRFGKKRGYRKRRNDKKTFAIAKSAARAVVNNQFEKHYFDYNPVAFNVQFTGNIQLLSAIPQGDTDSTRSGDRLTIKSVQVKGVCIGNDTTNACRVVLFQYLGDSAAAIPTIGTLFQNTGTQTAPYSPYSKDYAGYKWVPLWDKLILMDTYNPIKKFEIMVTAKDFKKKAKPFIQYQSGSTNNAIGHMYLVFLSDGGVAPDVTVAMQTRIRFIDN